MFTARVYTGIVRSLQTCKTVIIFIDTTYMYVLSSSYNKKKTVTHTYVYARVKYMGVSVICLLRQLRVGRSLFCIFSHFSAYKGRRRHYRHSSLGIVNSPLLRMDEQLFLSGTACNHIDNDLIDDGQCQHCCLKMYIRSTRDTIGFFIWFSM